LKRRWWESEETRAVGDDEMSTTELNEFPSDAFRAILAIDPEQRELIKQYMECSDEIQSVVRSMFAVLEHKYTTEEDRKRALSTIAEALFLNPSERHVRYSLDLSRVERDSVNGQTVKSRWPVVTNRSDPVDTQEATFADRLRQFLNEKNVTQEELADRIDCTQSAISKMLSRNARPHRKTILKLAQALGVAPTDLWPQLEVAAILDSVADFAQDQELTQKQAQALETASQRPPVKVKTRDLPVRKRT